MVVIKKNKCYVLYSIIHDYLFILFYMQSTDNWLNLKYDLGFLIFFFLMSNYILVLITP